MSADRRFDSTTTTTCGYCGVGCRLEAHARDGRIVSISPAEDGPANRGHTCVKGRFAHQYTRARDRLTAPLIRESDGVPRSARGTRRSTASPTSSCASRPSTAPTRSPASPPRARTNEDCYAMQRVFRAAIGTHNIDNCSRVCHSPTSFALAQVARPLRLHRLLRRHRGARRCCCSSARTRPQGHPVVGARMKQARAERDEDRHADPRRIELADYGVLHCGMRPGTNVAFLNGLAHVIIRDGLVDEEFVAARTDGLRGGRRPRRRLHA